MSDARNALDNRAAIAAVYALRRRKTSKAAKADLTQVLEILTHNREESP